MIVKYHSKLNNWGDEIGPVIFECMSGIRPAVVDVSFNNVKKEDIYLVVGSILQRADIYSIIWGPGFITETSKLIHKPKAIHAVRGPRTGQRLVEQGYKCGVYGDPVLLYPRFYSPIIEKKYKLGIIPHFIDKTSPFLDKFKKNSDVLIIDIQEGVNTLVDKVCSCELIASSSLHGVIVADAYNIPSIWVMLSYKVKGKGFKFRDYFESVNRKDKTPLIINEETVVQQLYDKFEDYSIDIDLDKLYDVCPFRKGR